ALNDGNCIPAIGLGTFGMRGADGVAAVAEGIRVGNRLLDTAHKYDNESEVGEGIRASGVTRDELFVTTKLRGRHHGYDQAFEGFAESLQSLGLDYVDLYIIHWPLPKLDRFVDSWRAMIELRDRGLVRSIGVSNFTADQLARLIDETGVTPAVNEIELHPHFPQVGMRAVHDSLGIVAESWGPLATQKSLITDPVITSLASVKDVSATRIILRWHVQLGAVPIPKSADPQRQRENLEVFDFELSADEMAAISALESERLWGGDPETHEEF
ncbi:MAG: aldo/keto reductase, partial [Salinibacterium sp.]|nr:aldo/keto reductase [Salinibacterium sp.]